MVKFKISIGGLGLSVLPVVIQAIGLFLVLAQFSDNSATVIAGALGGILFFETTKTRVHTDLSKLRAIWSVTSKFLANMATALNVSETLLSKKDYEESLEEELIIDEGGLDSPEHAQAATASGIADTIRSSLIVLLNILVAYHCVLLALSYAAG